MPKLTPLIAIRFLKPRIVILAPRLEGHLGIRRAVPARGGARAVMARCWLLPGAGASAAGLSTTHQQQGDRASQGPPS